MTDPEESSGSPGKGPGAILRLGGALAAHRLTHPVGFDPGRVVCAWAQRLTREGIGGSVPVRLGRRSFLLVGPGARSRAILEGSPARGGCRPGDLKRSGMSFLAPGALTIAHGEDWARLRAFHDHVLDFGEHHPLAQTVVDTVRLAFDAPVRSADGVRTAMGRVMLRIVLGEKGLTDSGLPADLHALFGAVQSPVRRRLFASRYRSLRNHLYTRLAARWEEVTPDDPCLLGIAKGYVPPSGRPWNPEELLQQIPHWMFTFTGSGTELLSRTMAIVTSRSSAYARVREELASAGPPDRAETVWDTRYLPACILETGRLFPPVTRTFHRGATNGGRHAEEGELIHYLPLFHRDEVLGPTAHEFRPERWLETEPDAAAAGSLTFLDGPRSCPGRTLILFVCAVALARQLGEGGMQVRSSRLSRDPLPVSFPAGAARFHPRKA